MTNSKQQLSGQYIDEHMHNVHTPESWARAVTELALKSAASTLGAQSKDSIAIDTKITIAAFEPLGCIRLCTNIGGVMVCYHVKT